MKFLITGITGFAGPNLANLLHREGHEIYGLIRSTNGRENDIRDIVPDEVYKDINFALGYSGNGVALSPYLGYKAALQVLDQTEGRTAFSKTKFERRFYYFGRPWFLKFASYRYRIKDFFENKKRAIN